MLYSLPELNQFSHNFFKEIKLAAAGRKNSLAYLVNPLPQHKIIKDGEIFQTLMIGGSHLETALAKAEKKEIILSQFDSQEVPSIENADILFDLVTKHLHKQTSTLALNFAYPMQSLQREDRLDGMLLKPVKNHAFRGLVNQMVGATLENMLQERLQRQVKISVCNDTTALGLASQAYYKNHSWKNTIVGVVGTGCNFGIFQDAQNFVNLESGNFNRFRSSQTGKMLDSLSSNFREQLLEKEVGGKYLVQHFNLLSNLADLSEHFVDSKQISELAKDGCGEAEPIAQQVLTHSAQLVAMKLKTLHDYLLDTHQASTPMLVMLEGSLYWKGHLYQQVVAETLHKLGLDPNRLQITHLENVGLKGAAHLALPLQNL